MTEVTTRRAGEFATKRFRERRRAWRRRFWWVFPTAGLFAVAMYGGLATILHGPHQGFVWGFGFGAAAAMVLILLNSPPAHIERWRQGAEGERATERALRPLTGKQWVLINDLDTGHGNIDHVLIGPAGVFLLETKNLGGIITVEHGVLCVRWHEDPSDGYENNRLAARVRGAAAMLAERLRAQGDGYWVQPLVVLWGAFDQRSIESDRVAWVRGKDLANVLAQRPITLDEVQISQAAAALRRAFAAPGAVPS
jgi:hypothetical protein